jgi:hypothetical protein
MSKQKVATFSEMFSLRIFITFFYSHRMTLIWTNASKLVIQLLEVSFYDSPSYSLCYNIIIKGTARKNGIYTRRQITEYCTVMSTGTTDPIINIP